MRPICPRKELTREQREARVWHWRRIRNNMRIMRIMPARFRESEGREWQSEGKNQ